MEITTIILMTLLQFAMGFGIISPLKLAIKPWMEIALSVLLGIALVSLALLLLIFFRIDITKNSCLTAIGLAAVVCNIYSFRVRFSNYRRVLSPKLITGIKLYEIPALLFLAFVFFVSAWRCFYFPPTPRDFTSGPEVIAEYTVKEKKIQNSVFTVNLESTNNQFKSPFLITLQFLYKYLGFPFGQVWMSTVYLFFLIFLYQVLTRYIHAVFAGALLLWFNAVPEMYAYSGIYVLYDYSNAVYFTAGLFFLLEFRKEATDKYVLLSGLFFALATYVRSETLPLVLLFVALYALVNLFTKTDRFPVIVKKSLFVVLPTVALYYITGPFYLNHYLPQHYDVAGLINKSLGNLDPFFTRLSDIYYQLLTGERGTAYFGNFLNLFVVFVVVDIALTIFYTKDKSFLEPSIWIISAILLVIGIAILGYLLPLMDLTNSTKRALFKLFPVLLLYFAYSKSLRLLSGKLS